MEGEMIPVNQETLKFFVKRVECWESHANGHILLFIKAAPLDYWQIYYDGKVFWLCDFERHIIDPHVFGVCQNFKLLHDPFKLTGKVENVVQVGITNDFENLIGLNSNV